MTVVLDRPAGALAPAGRARQHRTVAGRAALLVAALVAFSVAGALTVAPQAHPAPPLTAADYVAIEDAPVVRPAAPTRSYTVDCGRNLAGHRNEGNFITTPGDANGARHLHDYVGNTSTDGRSTDDSLAKASTTCAGGDRSAYFWPVLRETGTDRVIAPLHVAIRFHGNPAAPVRPMPRFLRVVTGDAKAITRGPANARASWSCSATPGRALAAQYPLCPAGQLVRRTAVFPSCWNGVATDSGNHRAHMAFPRADGACPAGFVPVPRLEIVLEHAVPSGRSYAVDSFPEEGRKAVTDHFDFVNVMPESLMRQVVERVNSPR